eukprot:579867_1
MVSLSLKRRQCRIHRSVIKNKQTSSSKSKNSKRTSISNRISQSGNNSAQKRTTPFEIVVGTDTDDDEDYIVRVQTIELEKVHRIHSQWQHYQSTEDRTTQTKQVISRLIPCKMEVFALILGPMDAIC